MKGHTDERHLARKVSLSTLYCAWENADIVPECQTSAIENLELKESTWDKQLCDNLIEGVLKYRRKLDAIVEECAPQWPLEKIFRIDLIIIEMAIYEMLHGTGATTPEKVVIDEAIELAKEYGNENSSKFVNGVLATVLERKEKYVLTENSESNS